MIPGSSPGLMTFDGSLTTNNVSLEIEIGGLIASADYDRVEVTGSALLDGELVLSLVDLGNCVFSPSAGDTFDVFEAAGGISGEFDALVAPKLPPGLAWNANYGNNLLTIEVLPTSTADFDGNGIVDGQDLQTWETGFGLNGAGDTDGDSDSDGADFLHWQRELQVGASATLSSIAIPEPPSILLLLAALMVSLPGRRAGG